MISNTKQRVTMSSKSDKNSGNSDKELAVKAKSEFNKGNYGNCVQILEKLTADKSCDVKLAHNKAVAEFYKGGLKKTESFQKALKAIFEKAKLRPERLETLEDVDTCVLYYNYAVILYHLRQYRAALGIVSKISRYIEPLVEPAMVPSVELNNGRKMPLLGLGCWQAPGDEVAAAVEAALLAGYRHIDTAYNYLNEDGVGRGIKAAIASGKVKRSDIFVVTKLPNIGMQAGKDVFPFENGKLLMDFSTDLIAIWKEMERMVSLGLTKSIGVSNFTVKQVRKILANAKIPPAVQQVECHVYFQQTEMREMCKQHNIAFTSYSSLGSPGSKMFMEKMGMKVELPDLLNNPVVRLVAEKHNRTAAQVLLRFLVQQDIIVIPKSVKVERIKQNGDLFSFKLDEVDMGALRLLDQGEAGRIVRMKDLFPNSDMHPEAPH
ncbi:Aldose reductase [Amphibalanus amphitrite]|uniref:Aldose reductase n=1 Tax=Amphibalanus amphitrite TaxID=1232801 RepID=A0A6A4VMS8_AMPAM|nr:Aldose reductase [Amphibalanus amphitrite]